MALPVLPLPADIEPYLDEVTSEHRDKLRFILMMSFLLRNPADTAVTEGYYYRYFDLDEAVGYMLDCVGEWVGRNRILAIPAGFFQLPDEQYRVLLRAVIAANHWDGTIPNAYDAWGILFEGTPYRFLIQDYPNGEMAIGIVGPSPPDDIMLALFTSGELDIKPMGVRLWHVLPTQWPAGPGGAPI